MRPAIHLTPPSGWMNDPNGLVLHDGVWHAAYQHNPAGPIHGNVHWRRATSTDLLHWTDRGLMLTPDHLGQIYSGSMVIDHDNTAGFGAGSLVAIYTHHLRDGVQRQSLAVSTDGERWVPYAGNPVLESDAHDFRDPKVLRWSSAAGSWWVMALAVGQRIDLYRSPDLRTWRHTGSFAEPVGGSGVWECPDLVALEGGQWLLMFGIAEGGPGNHSATLGVLGSFNGESFTPHGTPELVDHGPDCYAMQTFSGTPCPGRPATALAWMSSWRYAATYPAPDGWLGRMTLPRTIALDARGRLVFRPAPSLTGPSVELGRNGRVTPARGRALVVEPTGSIHLEISDVNNPRARALVSIDRERVTLDRHAIGIEPHDEHFEAVLDGDGPATVVIDHGSIEVFADGGASTLSALIPTESAWHCRVDGEARLTELP